MGLFSRKINQKTKDKILSEKRLRKVRNLMNRMENCLTDDFDKYYKTDMLDWIKDLTDILRLDDEENEECSD